MWYGGWLHPSLSPTCCLQGYAWAAANPAEAADILFDAVASDIKRGAMAALPIPLDREMCRASQEYVSARYLSSEGHWGVMQQKMWDDFLDWLSENGLLTTAIQSRKEGVCMLLCLYECPGSRSLAEWQSVQLCHHD